MLELPDAWVWDFWIADTGTEYHVFFLRASRALHDPERRHLRASVGHAVSDDLTDWTLLPDALVPGDEPRWDDLATWTGSVLAGPDGVWRMFYTGVSRAEQGRVQRIGVATSEDLMSWNASSQPLVVSDGRWYGCVADGDYDTEFWRDPWVFADPGGAGWHMLVTARARVGALDDRGVLGHAWSPDLATWEVRPPVTAPGAGFSQLEVPQIAVVDGAPVLVFSCRGAELAARRRGTRGGSWTLPVDRPDGPFDVAAATVLLDEGRYSARLVQARDGGWVALAFDAVDAQGRFGGRLCDPLPVHSLSPGVLSI